VNSYKNTLHERNYEPGYDREYDRETGDSAEQDREISLGATTIIGIFFALALVCSLFFGLGYSMGRKAAPSAAATTTEAPVTSTSSAAKPPSGSLADMADAPPAPTSEPAPTPARTATPAPAAAEKIEAKPPVVPAAVATGGTILVQIAAVSHREDADVLLSTLKQRGYDVFIRNEPQDKLLHVQVGPFPTRKDADIMKQRLLADGYNAIIK
jgi:DedD protein